MRRIVVLAVVMLCSIATAAALRQVPAQSPPTGLILGRVVDAITNAPVAGVVVSIAATRAGAPGAPAIPDPRVITDVQGRFLFRGLPPGGYQLVTSIGGANAYSPNGFVVSGSGFPIGGYLNGGFGQRRPNGPLQTIDLAEGERLSQVMIKIWKAGAISGRLSDEAGEPLVNQVVGAVQVSSDGRLLTGPTVRTDDRGAYRLAGLAPGHYVVFVPQTQVSMPLSIGEELANGAPDPTVGQRFSFANAPSPRVGGVRVGSSLLSTVPDGARFGGDALISNALAPVRDGEAVHVYPTTFFPSATRLAQSTRITLPPGEDRSGTDIQLKPVRAGSIAGVVVDDAGPVPTVGLHLMPADMGREASILEAALTATDGSGAFSFPAVPAGQYTILAWRTGGVPTSPGQPAAARTRVGEADGAWARQLVTVGGGRSTENITVTMRPPVTVSGRVVFEGAATPPTAERLRTGFLITIYGKDVLFRTPGPSPGSTIDVANGGRIAITRVSPPGRFLFGLPGLPPLWTLQSVTVGGRDVTDAAVEVGESDITDAVIIYTDRPASLNGTVTGQPASDSETSVFLFPAAKSRWPEARLSPRTFRVARTAKSGAFSLSNVLPGEYLIVAIRDDGAGDWPDEFFLNRLAAIAAPIRIAANQSATTTLKMSVLK